MKRTALLRKSGHSVTVYDLYREHFDPLLLYDEIPRDAVISRQSQCTVMRLQQRTGSCSSTPAGGDAACDPQSWIVLRPGVAYRFAETDAGEGIPVGLLTAKAVTGLQYIQQSCGT